MQSHLMILVDKLAKERTFIGPLLELTLQRSHRSQSIDGPRKADVVAAVVEELLSFETICERHSLTAVEFASWQGALDRNGAPGRCLRQISIGRQRQKFLKLLGDHHLSEQRLCRFDLGDPNEVGDFFLEYAIEQQPRETRAVV